jgi:type I restriction enzyme R subunit
MDRIRDHLRENLSIDQEDFETLPIFTRYGGWGKVQTVFKDQLPELIKEFNRAIAA